MHKWNLEKYFMNAYGDDLFLSSIFYFLFYFFILYKIFHHFAQLFLLLYILYM